MGNHSENTYDAIIIGAGMSGLVCGCYLAKAGLKVLIAEQHSKPGGYCTSFKRKGFTFDAAAHSFGGYRKDGIVRKVFDDLGVAKRVRIKRYDPSDIIITPDYEVSFWSDLNKTIEEFQKVFPEESININEFFCSLISPTFKSFARMRSWTFKDLLDRYFNNDKLKAILSFPLLGNGGLPPSAMSAFIGASILKEFLLDGGYYPEGGMQALPLALAERFKDLGGEIRLSCLVKKIKVNDGKAIGAVLARGGFIGSGCIVSGCDSRQTFFKLLGSRLVDQELLNAIKDMTPSLSMFIVYLGLNKSLDKMIKPGTNVWLLSNYRLDNSYLFEKKVNLDNVCTMVRAIPDQNIILAFMNAPFKNKNYWHKNKAYFTSSFIEKIEKYILPNLSKYITYKETATPHTLYRYTLNYKGAAYGWASTPSQLAIYELRKPKAIQGLFLTGHWTTEGIGIPGVVHLGYDTAKQVLRKQQQRQIKTSKFVIN